MEKNGHTVFYNEYQKKVPSNFGQKTSFEAL